MPSSADKSYKIPVPKKTPRSQHSSGSTQSQDIDNTSIGQNIQTNSRFRKSSELEEFGTSCQRKPARFGPGIGAHIGKLGPVTLNTLAELGVKPKNKKLDAFKRYQVLFWC